MKKSYLEWATRKAEQVFERGSVEDLISRVSQIRYEFTSATPGMHGVIVRPKPEAILDLEDASSFLQYVGFDSSLTVGGLVIRADPEAVARLRVLGYIS